MLKRIHVNDLTMGMYVHELCGSWMEHPFWRTRFALKDARDLARIRASTIAEVWIDTARGPDVAAHVPATSRREADAQADAVLHAAHQQPRPTPALEPATMAQELQRASQVCASARRAVTQLFHEARLGGAVDVTGALTLVDEIGASITRHPGALISLARLKTADEYTYMHSVAVSALMLALARQLGLDDAGVRMAGQAGLLHDLGKARVPLELLNKPGKLDEQEFAVVQSHPLAGHAMLVGSGLPQPVLDACLHHHEKIDGSGYPDRLQGQGIGLLARMAAVCDVYDAITSNRPYKRGWDPALALHRMAEWTHSHFDNRIFQAFVKTMGIYPVGALVRLQSQRLAVVVEQSPEQLLAPRVKVFYALPAQRRIALEIVDLAAPANTDKIIAREDPGHWPFTDLQQLWSGQAAPAW